MHDFRMSVQIAYSNCNNNNDDFFYYYYYYVCFSLNDLLFRVTPV